MATATPLVHPTPEVESIPALLSSSILQDQKFLLVAIIVGSVLFLIYFGFGSSAGAHGTIASGKGKPLVALTGAPDAGKTTIFSALALQQQPQTHTSLAPSSSLITLPSSTSSGDVTLALVDLPGHPRMRQQTQRTLRDSKLKGVVFVVDAAALVRNAAMVAEELVPILISLCARSLTNGSQEPPKLLIMGNKADLLTKPSSVANQPLSSPATSKATSPSLDAKAYTLARERLESLLTRELTRAKSSRASSTGRIEGIDAVPSGTVSTSLLGYVKRLLRLGTGAAVGQAGEAERDAKEEEWRVEQAEDAMWGERNGSFKFSDVDGVDIQFAVGSAMGGKGLESQDGLTELKDWLSEL